MTKILEVRARRAYLDTRFGQLHVRTAFPGTGGFDEHTTLLCIHALRPNSSVLSGRVFAPFLGLIAVDRSAYAPDRPGCGESDGEADAADAGPHALAMADLAADLRVRKLDVLGLEDGCEVALELAMTQPELVRRLVLASSAPPARASQAKQPTLVLRLGAQGTGAQFAADVFEHNAGAVAKPVGSFLNQR